MNENWQNFSRKSKTLKKRRAELIEVKYANKKFARLIKKLTTKSISQRHKITTITEKLEGLKLELKARIMNLQLQNKLTRNDFRLELKETKKNLKFEIKLTTKQNKLLKRKLDRINKESMT